MTFDDEVIESVEKNERVLNFMINQEKETFTCPKCEGELVKRKGRYGEFIGCENFPECRFTKNDWVNFQL